MGTKGEGNRQRIIDAADLLFYQRGYSQTSFQDISDATDIPRGNFYYYFKTKDEILEAVVKYRLASFTALLSQCEASSDDARERLLMFSNMLEANEGEILRSGCPVGTLSSELAKNDAELHKKSKQVFLLFRYWLKNQFATLGFSNADELAMDLLAKLQGITVVACAFNDVDYIKRSHAEVKDWINSKVLQQA
jgi:TetR/AcrR family transcriptional repressor of nem operon